MQPLVEGNFLGTRVLAVGVLIISCLSLAYAWRRPDLHPSRLRAGAEKIAGDFRWWFGIVCLLWLYTMAMDVLTEIRRNNQIVALRNDVQSIARVIERGVLPRTLTRRQRLSMASFLKAFEPSVFVFNVAANNSEASGYRAEIEEVLKSAKWKAAIPNPYRYMDDLPEGLSLRLVIPDGSAQPPDDPAYPTPERILWMAFGNAGVRISGGPGTGSDPGAKLGYVLISIGAAKKDSGEFTSPEFPF